MYLFMQTCLHVSTVKTCTIILISFAKNCEYNSLENYILWDLFRRVNHVDNYALYDEIRINYPDVNDKHILTMLKAAFKLCFGYDVETFSYTTL